MQNAKHLLGSSCTFHLGKVRGRIHSAQENGLELIHAGIGKKQRGIIVGHNAAAWYYRVPLARKEVQECLPHPVACTLPLHSPSAI